MMEENTGDVPLPKPALTVGIIYNVKKADSSSPAPDAQAEFDCPETVQAIRAAIASGGYRTELLEADGTLPSALLEKHIDIAFNIAEGLRGRGREAEVPAVLNLLGIPFTGSDETALGVALDKALCKKLLAWEGIPTPGFAVVSDEAGLDSVGALRFPVIVKPNAEGSSKGIRDVCVAADAAELRALLADGLRTYGEEMLAEEYVHGREFTVGILGNGKTARVFPPMEIAFRRNTQDGYAVYSFGVKQDYKKYVDYKCPAPLTAEQDGQMRDYALRAFRALGCHDFTRVDFRMDAEGRLYFIEINPLPGLAPGYSDYPMLAEFSGVSYDELVLSVLRAALRRLGLEAAE